MSAAVVLRTGTLTDRVADTTTTFSRPSGTSLRDARVPDSGVMARVKATFAEEEVRLNSVLCGPGSLARDVYVSYERISLRSADSSSYREVPACKEKPTKGASSARRSFSQKDKSSHHGAFNRAVTTLDSVYISLCWKSSAVDLRSAIHAFLMPCFTFLVRPWVCSSPARTLQAIVAMRPMPFGISERQLMALGSTM